MNRTRTVLAVAVAAVTLAVWGVAELQRSAADRAFDESRAAAEMETAMLDQQATARSFMLTGDRRFIPLFQAATREFGEAAGDAGELAQSDEHRSDVDAIVAAANRWRGRPDQVLGRLAGGPPTDAAGEAEVRRRMADFEAVRGRIDAFQADLDAARDDRLARAGLISMLAIAGLAVLFLVGGLAAIEREMRKARSRRAESRRYRETQEEFAEALQIMRGESEAHELVKHHLERTIPGAEVTVLKRNNSANRLTASTPVEDSDLAERLVDAEPGACFAVRLGHTHEQGAATDPLLACSLCGRTAAESLCTPSLVGGEVIGSVLVRNERSLDERERERVAASVSQAAPVLANLRNLAVAEMRAATDALTGLPNSRSCRDNLKRMVAHASRAGEPLAAVMVDLDRFKQVNDRFGHGAGDDVLAAVGEAVRATLRTSDFGGRYGGEELLLLLPGTDRDGAAQLAGKLGRAIAALEFPQPDLRITASLGVAAYPDDALDGDALLRMADRALYAAKSRGRNRVELVDAAVRAPEPHDVRS